MATNWRFIDLSRLQGRAAFNKRTRQVDVFDREGSCISSFPPIDVDVLFIGIGISLSSSVLHHLGNKGAMVVLCDWAGLPVASLLPWTNTHGRICARQLAQAQLSKPRQKNAWMRVVKAKIRGQAAVLRALELEGAGQLEKLASSVKTGDASNVEGQAARYYWRRLFGEGFRRLPGDGEDGINCLLDYAYTVLRGFSARAVFSAGLNPVLGLYHHGRSNAFPLADDLIEPFRPVADIAVARLETRFSLDDRSVRGHLVQACSSSFGSSGLGTPATMIDLAQQYGRYVEGEVAYLDVPVWKENSNAGVS